MNYNDFAGYLLLFIAVSYIITFLFKSVIMIFKNLDK